MNSWGLALASPALKSSRRSPNLSAPYRLKPTTAPGNLPRLRVDAAKQLDDLRVPPGNRLEALHGDRRGQHSTRINDQWRIRFEWREGAGWNVEVVNYHK